MRILIDMQGMQGVSQKRGIGRYTQSFVHALITVAKEHEIYLLLNGLYPDTAKQIQKEFSTFLPSNHFLVFDAVGPVHESNPENEKNARISEFLREKFIKDISPDFLILTSLFEGMDNDSVTSIAAYTSEILTAVIFYDLIPYIHDDIYLNTPKRVNWYMRKFNYLKQADALLCISFSAQNEAMLYLDKNSNDMTVISSATDRTFHSIENDPTILHRYGIVQPYIMHASAYEGRKNFEGLIQAFALLPEAVRKQHQLVLVCVLTEKQKNNLLGVAKNAGLNEDELILTGYISDDDLVTLYTKATLFVFPSKHEGFGLPPLEAMACGTATIGSDLSSIPEVIGRSDALFDPLDIESMAEKITEVLTDDDFRKALETHAPLQAEKFSWNLTAQKALALLEEKYQKQPVAKKEISVQHSTVDLIESLYTHGLLETLDKTQLLRMAQAIERNEKSVLALMADGYFANPLCWRVEGPFDSTYSLAMINREIALTLEEKGYDVVLHSTEGPGDFLPDNTFLEEHPEVNRLYQKSIGHSEVQAEVSSRNLYPPRVHDMKSSFNLLHNYAWEESVFPQEWVKDFNHALQGVVCTSKHVEKIMIDNGVSVPLAISGNGVDHWARITSDNTYRVKAKSFRFLHVSSCFPRKGADVLLKAYGDLFSDKDDVTLIVKTFPNPHNEIHQWLEEAKKENVSYPHVLIIEDDLTDAQLKALYESSHALVAPSRAEGFGLPLAEAMLSGLPVITTGWSGQRDFCNEETAWLTDYDFTSAQTHFNLYNSVWAEPSRTDLSRAMHEVYTLSEAERQQKSKAARKLLLEKFSWTKTAERLTNFVKAIPRNEILFEKPKIGWITTWNTPCGIASYSQHLIDALGEEVSILASQTDHTVMIDGTNVYRCWQPGEEDDLEILQQTIERLELDTIVIQFNYGFFNFNYFTHFLNTLNKSGKTVIIMLHATTDPIQASHKKLSMLSKPMHSCSRLLVHTINDLNRMKTLGLLDNVSLFPHGVVDWKSDNIKDPDLFTLSTYGFFLPHKGLLEMITVLKQFHNKGMPVKLKMVNARYPVPESEEMIRLAKEKIKEEDMEGHIELITDFLTDEASLKHLSSSDLIVFPYQETAESSSASVRYGLATGIPVAVTPLNIFSDVESAVYRLSGCTPEEMAESLTQIISGIQEHSDAAQQMQHNALAWVEAHRYSMLGKRLYNMMTALHRKNTQ